MHAAADSMRHAFAAEGTAEGVAHRFRLRLGGVLCMGSSSVSVPAPFSMSLQRASEGAAAAAASRTAASAAATRRWPAGNTWDTAGCPNTQSCCAYMPQAALHAATLASFWTFAMSSSGIAWGWHRCGQPRRCSQPLAVAQRQQVLRPPRRCSPARPSALQKVARSFHSAMGFALRCGACSDTEVVKAAQEYEANTRVPTVLTHSQNLPILQYPGLRCVVIHSLRGRKGVSRAVRTAKPCCSELR